MGCLLILCLTTPISPPSGPAPRLLQGSPSKSKFLAASPFSPAFPAPENPPSCVDASPSLAKRSPTNRPTPPPSDSRPSNTATKSTNHRLAKPPDPAPPPTSNSSTTSAPSSPSSPMPACAATPPRASPSTTRKANAPNAKGTDASNLRWISSPRPGSIVNRA